MNSRVLTVKETDHLGSANIILEKQGCDDEIFMVV